MKLRTLFLVLAYVLIVIFAPSFAVACAMVVGLVLVVLAINKKINEPFVSITPDPPPLKEVVYMVKSVYGTWNMCSEQEYIDAGRRPDKYMRWKGYV